MNFLLAKRICLPKTAIPILTFSYHSSLCSIIASKEEVAD